MNPNNRYLILSIFLYAAVVQAQEYPTSLVDSVPVELSEIMVTATRTKKQFSSLPMPAQLITDKEIKAINSVRLSEVLNEQTGLLTVPDFGGGEGIQLQGFDSQYTLILIDGMPLVGRSAGTLDLNRISVGNIKQIEIVKGASSSLYGNEALGGVINIITEKPKNGWHGNVDYRYSTFNTHDISSNLQFRKNKLGVSVFLNRFSSNGYDLNEDDALNTVEPFQNYTFDTKLTYTLSDKTSVLLSARYYTQHQDYVASASLSGESVVKEWNTLFQLKHHFSDTWNSAFEFYATNYGANEFLNDEMGATFSSAAFDQHFMRPEYRTTYAPSNNHSFVAGLGLTLERLDRSDFLGVPSFTAPYVYFQYDGQIAENINVILGARFDQHSEYSSQLSPKAALRYEISKKLALKSSVGYGFKAPDFRQLYFDFSNTAVGYSVLGYNAVSTRLPALEQQGELIDILVPATSFNDKLKAENSISFNLGLDYAPSSALKFHVNYFRNNISNLIDIRVIARKANGQNVFSYYNVDEVYTQGLEYNASWQINENISLSGGYQLLYAKNKKSEEAFEQGKVFARPAPNAPTFQLRQDDYFGLFNRSRHMANIKLFCSLPSWGIDANIRGTYRSRYGLFDSNGNQFLDTYDEFVEGYTIWDFALNKRFKDSWTLGIGSDNIFHFTDPPNISNIAGRLLYGKIHFTF